MIVYMIKNLDEPCLYWKQGPLIGQHWTPQNEATVWSNKKRVELVVENIHRKHPCASIQEFELCQK